MKLSTVFELEEKIQATRDAIKRMKASAASASTTRLDGLPRPKNFSSRVESLAIKITDRERELAALVEESAIAQIDLTIEISDKVEGAAGEVLYQRYILCRPFAEIAAAMDYSQSQIYQLHRRGVAEFNGERQRVERQKFSPSRLRIRTRTSV